LILTWIFGVVLADILAKRWLEISPKNQLKMASKFSLKASVVWGLKSQY